MNISAVSSLRIAALAVAALKDLRVTATTDPLYSTDDFSYVGVLCEDGSAWTVKYPRCSEAGAAIEAEAGIAKTLLAQLREGNLPFDVLRPAGFTQVKHGRALVYRAPAGKTLDFTLLTPSQARELGRTLGAVHNLPRSVITDAGLPAYSTDSWRERRLAELTNAAESSSVPVILRRRWEDMLQNDELWNFTPTVLHGDPAEEHFLWSGGKISAVLGFGEAQCGDPAADFAALTAQLSKTQADSVFDAYSNARDVAPDPHFLRRSVLMNEFSIVEWLLHGIHKNDPKIIEDAGQMLDALAEDVLASADEAPEPKWEMDLDAADAAVHTGFLAGMQPAAENEDPENTPADADTDEKHPDEE